MKYFFSLILIFSLFSFKEIPVYNKQELLGKFNPETHKDFTKVTSAFSDKNIYLRKETFTAFKKMARAAQKSGVNLFIISGTRTYTRQSEIWEEKWERFKGDDLEKAEEILLYSSMPGTSRHHWGTDFDINALEPEYFETNPGINIYQWLEQNAWKFGFFQPYNKLGEGRNLGYKEEKWHWSYYPIANQMLRAYNNLIKYDDLKGYKGAELSKALNVFKQYVNSIYIPKNLDYEIIRNSKLN